LKPVAPAALAFYSSLLYKSCTPTTQTFIAIMNSCISSGHWQEAIRLSVSLIDEDYETLTRQQQQQQQQRRQQQQQQQQQREDEEPSLTSFSTTTAASNAHPLIFTAALQALGKKEVDVNDKDNNKWMIALRFATYLIEKQQQMILDAAEREEVKKRKSPILRRTMMVHDDDDDDSENFVDEPENIIVNTDGDDNDDDSSESLFSIVDKEHASADSTEEETHPNSTMNEEKKNENREEEEKSSTSIKTSPTSLPLNHLSWIDDAFLVELLQRLGAAGKWKEAVTTFSQFTPELVSASTVAAVSDSVTPSSKNNNIDKKLQDMWSKKRM